MMPNSGLSSELAAARRRLAELEAADAERRRAEQVQSALYRIAELASAAQDMHEFYRAVQAVVGELMYAKNFFIALYDEERQLISWPYYADEVDLDVPDPNQWDAFGEGNARGTTAYVLRTGEPQLLTYQRMEELIEEGEIELVGVTVEDASWLGAALSRARAIEETRQRNAELALINSVQAAIAGELDPQAIYDLVGDKLQEVFDAQVVSISVYDEASGQLSFPYVIERGERLEEAPIPLLGFRKHVIETREPLMLDESTPEV